MRTLAQMAGYGIGALWIVLAIWTLASAAQGLGNARLDWATGWGLVGVLLLAAGALSIIGTWWHLNRVGRQH